MSRMFDNVHAFSPFFDTYKGGESICVVTTRNNVESRTSLSVCVLASGMVNGAGEGFIETDSQSVVFVFEFKDWPFASSLRRGDVVERVDGRKYQVSQASYDDALGWTVTAREQ